MSGYPYRNTKPKYVEKKQQNQTTTNQIPKNELPQQPKKIQHHQQQNGRRPKYQKFKYHEKREDDQHSEDQDNKRRDHRQNRNHHHKKYDRNEDNIKHYTQIDSLPQVRKVKPDQEAFRKKIVDLQGKIAQNKQLRKQEKQKLKKAEEQYHDKIKQAQKKIHYGEKVLFQYQKNQSRIKNQIQRTNQYIVKLQNKIKNAEKKPQQKKKKPEQMSYEQLDTQLKKLEHKLMTSNLTKNQNNQIIIQRNHLTRLKINAVPNAKKSNENNEEQYIQVQKNKLIDARQKRKQLKIELVEIQTKLRAIDADLQKYDKQLQQLIQAEKTFKNGPEYEKAKQYKEQIRKLRNQLKQVQTHYYNQLDDYNEEQKLIEYIGWANQVKKKKIQQNQVIKEQKRKQRQKQRRRQEKKGTEKDQKTKKGEQKQTKVQQPQKERLPPPHPFSKQILDLRFLIEYCNNLKPQQEKQEASQVAKTKEQIQKQIQKGQWAKEKGISIVKSKKENDLQFAITSNKGKKKPNSQTVIKQQAEKPIQFTHIIQIVRLFDAFKILPPRKIEDLQSALKQLEQKKTYYQNLTVEDRSKQFQQKRYEKKNPDQKTTKSTIPAKKTNLSIIDFPDLV